MYGGHITDGWDRRLCQTYLQEFMHPKMVSLISICVICFFGGGVMVKGALLGCKTKLQYEDHSKSYYFILF